MYCLLRWIRVVSKKILAEYWKLKLVQKKKELMVFIRFFSSKQPSLSKLNIVIIYTTFISYLIFRVIFDQNIVLI